ncbi:TRAP transporter small permease subunit [Desulfogranum marinum]|jgi:TRAP-type mannitol/chloroaromatic compound transport system permease small subunit|uniref:TRAP transporter small permease subunit n=1 Tax=Desulfogranum marinum TaxID=453220 RepID=UPI0029C98799|nr:TRAP transporter small permease subunit [Desulfogranum marinum]
MNNPTAPQRPHSLFIFVRGIEKLVVCIGKTVAWLNLLLIGVILVQVSMRYIFNYNSVALEELQWHLYGVGIMMGLSYALTTNSHVRLDLFHARFSRTTKAWIDMVGLLILVLPWCYVVISHGMDFVAAAWRVSERSNSPGGLCCYWIIKSVLPISFGLFFLAALARIARAVLYLTGSIERNQQHGA